MKKILCAFLVFALIFTLGACKKNPGDDTTAGDATTLAGQTDDTTAGEIEYVTDENGEVVTDENGNPVVAETVPLISDETMPAGEIKEVTTDASGKPVNSLIDSALGSIFKGDKYSIKFTTQVNLEGAKQTMPASIYVSGKKSLIEMSMNSAQLGKMSILNNGTGKYFLISAVAGLLKGYVKVPDDQSDEYSDLFDFSSFSANEDMKYIKTTTVTYKGVQYVCEEYRSGDTNVKFYFNNGSLKRIEQVSDDGSKVFMENIVITASFSENVFNIPSGYKELKESDFAAFSNLFG